MASLREIAAANAEEIRDGIAWVIVWKTGRSWHAKPVWLNSETDKLGPEDEKQVQEILQQDPNAVMINGYYSGHLGESMTLKELEDGIRWHYEKDIRLRNAQSLSSRKKNGKDIRMYWDRPPEVICLRSRKFIKQGTGVHSQQSMLFVFYPEENAGRLFAAGNHPDNRI